MKRTILTRIFELNALAFLVLMSYFFRPFWLIPIYFISALALIYLQGAIVILSMILLLPSRPNIKIFSFLLTNSVYFLNLYIFRQKYVFKGTQQVDKNKTYLFVSNHKSELDPFGYLEIYDKLTLAFTPKSELYKSLILRKVFKMLNCIKIYRADIRKTLVEMNIGIQKAQAGQSFLTYIEGGIKNRTLEEIEEVKPAALKLAYKAKAEIMPVASFGMVRKNRFFPLIRKTVYLYFLEPISYNSYCLEPTDDMALKLKDQINLKIKQHKEEMSHDNV